MLKKILENEIVSFVILAVRLYLGIWFLNHVISQGMYHPQAWAKIGGAMHFLGINFLPSVWGFLAFLAYVLGSLLVISGIFFRFGAAAVAVVLLVAANMHFALGQGMPVAKHALNFCIAFLILIITGPGIYVLPKYITLFQKQGKSK
jgi:putative oxidoreductase